MSRARVRVKFSERCTGRIGLYLHLGSAFVVRETVQVKYRVTVMHG